ncbi:2-phospho-L-lactate transferase [Rhabdothermincola salaria]|uniref:2-phospho-L-lactate transferase n=1 Tax=Rhabdothermincola salaria TaxID=2903142 RepID=UPI001E3CED69|nr:2-phospho-L-lactate transferase [Rhabdothermincola salaria]MCD9623340.1 2-phospho-L-lactate transferase [Rhabdothermincola salaria]
MITVIAGGVGAARLLAGLVRVVDPAEVVAVVNVGDDLELHGLRICPDLDTITYTLADAVDPDRGWGLRDESWQAMEMVGRYGGESWFGLGDRDLGTHLYRTQRLAEGADLVAVTEEITRAWGLALRLLPVTTDRLRTMVTLGQDDAPGPDSPGLTAGTEVGFQEYFVQRRHAVPVAAVRVDGADLARPAPGVLEAIADADVVVVAPSNPIVSIAPVLAVPGVRRALVARRDDVVAVSPIVAGAALKGPADRLMTELGHEASVVGVARLYAPFAATLVVDEADLDAANIIEAEGIRPVVAPTVMRTPQIAAELGRVVIDAGRGLA